MRLIIEGSVEEIKKFLGGDMATKVKVDGSEIGVNEEPKLTRADVVAKAQRDVKELLSRNYSHSGGDPVSIWFVSEGGKYTVLNNCKFFVNREKRTVTALIEDIRDSSIELRGIARCAPDDVFNADIGKAIALRRALKLEVPDEYLNAPRPEDVVVGDIVRYCDYGVGKVVALRPKYLDEGQPYLDYKTELKFVRKDGISFWTYIKHVEVIDDTDREEYRALEEINHGD